MGKIATSSHAWSAGLRCLDPPSHHLFFLISRFFASSPLLLPFFSLMLLLFFPFFYLSYVCSLHPRGHPKLKQRDHISRHHYAFSDRIPSIGTTCFTVRPLSRDKETRCMRFRLCWHKLIFMTLKKRLAHIIYGVRGSCLKNNLHISSYTNCLKEYQPISQRDMNLELEIRSILINA